MIRAVTISAALLIAALITGCSSESERQDDERHVWSDQTDTIERARQVEQTVQDAADRQRQALEDMEQGRRSD